MTPTLGRRAERQACEIRLRAERRAGELLRDMEKAVTGPKISPHNGEKIKPGKGEQIASLGVSKKQAENRQKLADVEIEAPSSNQK